jgi:hypothetical protein
MPSHRKRSIAAGRVDSHYSAKLNCLVEEGVLEHPDARSIARNGACNGVSGLTPKEAYLYVWHIVPHLPASLSYPRDEVRERPHVHGPVPKSKCPKRQ